ncbi:MAG: rod shape-determining protein, partial [Alphaproteobacteria bacterium]
LEKIHLKLARCTGVKYKIPEDPLRCVVLGTGMALEQGDAVKDILTSVQ